MAVPMTMMVPMMPVAPVVPVATVMPMRFLDSRYRHGCAGNGLGRGGHSGSAAFPEGQGTERNTGCDSESGEACTHKKFSWMNALNARNVAALS